MKRPSQDKKVVFIGIGMEIIALVVVGSLLGGYLDKKFALKGMGTAGLVLGALIFWLVHVLQLLKRINQERQDPDA